MRRTNYLSERLFETDIRVSNCLLLLRFDKHSLCRFLRSKGILCLVDEVQTGFGRCGTHYWAFQSYEEGKGKSVVS